MSTDPCAGKPAPWPVVCTCRPQGAPESRTADPDAWWVDPDRSASPWARPGDDQYVGDVMRIAWVRGAASILFDWEQAHPAGNFGSGGLGLVAAQLLDLGDLLQARLPAPRGDT